MKALPLLNGRLNFVAVTSIDRAHAETTIFTSSWKWKSPRIRLAASVTDVITKEFHPVLLSQYFEQLGARLDIPVLSVDFAENAIFHEFLHVMRVDNLSPQEHSYAVRIPSNSPTGTFERDDDNVFACANLVYPADDVHQFWKQETKESEWSKVAITRASCRVCYRAFGNKVSENHLSKMCDKY